MTEEPLQIETMRLAAEPVMHRMNVRGKFTVRAAGKRACYCAFLSAIAIAGCQRAEAPPVVPMTTEEIIRQERDVPVGESIKRIATSLARHSVFVGSEDGVSSQPGKLRFRTAPDNQGRLWVYAYTSESQFSRAFPQGGSFIEMSFADLFDIVEGDSRFAGIFLNSASDASYPIPRELFEDVKQSLRRAAS